MKLQDKQMSACKRSPISPSFSQQPWLLQLHGTEERTLSFINPIDGSIEEQSVPEMEGKVCLGCFGEWVLLLERKSKGMSLLNLTSLSEIELPPMSESFESLGCFALSSSPTSSRCLIVTVGRRHNFILYCRPKDQRWTKIQPIDNGSFHGAIAINQGRIYALLRRQAVVIIDLESLPTGVINGKIINRPHSFDYDVKRLVVSSEGVFFVFVKCSSRQVLDVEIYTLDTSLLANIKYELLDWNVRFSESTPWRRLGGINGRVFLLGGDYSISMSANQVGLQGNSMYLLHPTEDGLRLYKIFLDDNTSTSKVLFPEELNACNKLYWVVSNRSRRIKQKTIKSSPTLINKVEERTSDSSISWDDMPMDVIQELLLILPLRDRICLTSVCKSWNFFSKYIPRMKVFPWLMYSSDSGSLNFVDSFYGVEHSLQMNWLGSEGKLNFHCSKDGWFIASDRNMSLFMLNPLTRLGIKLPSLKYYWILDMSYSFSSVPTNSDCFVLAVYANVVKCILYTWNWELDHWREQEIYFTGDPFFLSPVSPVFFHDQFYILGGRGDLMIFNPTTTNYLFLDTLLPIQSAGVVDIIIEECYLLELDGELAYVSKHSMTESYTVYKLDRSKMIWIELRDLGGMTAFLSRSSMSRPSRNGLYANGMLFPRLHGEVGKQPVFYSMQNHAFELKSEDVKEIMNCIWFEPNLFASKSKRIEKMFTVL